MKGMMVTYIVKISMETVIIKSLCEEVEFLKFCFFFAFERKMIKISFKNLNKKTEKTIINYNVYK